MCGVACAWAHVHGEPAEEEDAEGAEEVDKEAVDRVVFEVRQPGDQGRRPPRHRVGGAEEDGRSLAQHHVAGEVEEECEGQQDEAGPLDVRGPAREQ